MKRREKRFQQTIGLPCKTIHLQVEFKLFFFPYIPKLLFLYIEIASCSFVFGQSDHDNETCKYCKKEAITRKTDSEVIDIYLLHKLPDEDFALESNVSTYLQFPSEPITKKLLRCCRLANLAAPATWEVKVKGFKGIKRQRDDFMNSYLPDGVCLLRLFTAWSSFRKEK